MDLYKYRGAHAYMPSIKIQRLHTRKSQLKEDGSSLLLFDDDVLSPIILSYSIYMVHFASAVH